MQAPSSFTTTVISSTRINLSWADPDPLTPTPDHVEIQRKVQGGVYSTIDSVPFGQDYYYDISVSQSIKYYYRIRYYLDISHYSSWVITSGDWTPPTDPSVLAVTFVGDVATLTWINNGTYTSVIVDLYGISTTTIDGALETCAITCPAENTAYSFEIRAYRSDSTLYSNFIPVGRLAGTTGINPPTNFLATCPTTTSCNLSWNDNSSVEDGYEIYRDGTLITFTAIGATSYSDSPLTESTTYVYTIRGKSGTVYSAYATVTITTGAMPDHAPNTLAVTATGQTTILLTWVDGATNATGIEIQRSLDDVTYALLTTVVLGVQTYTDISLTSNTLYYYKIRAYNDSGYSAFTFSLSATTNADLDPPTNIVATAISDTQIRLDFTNASADATALYVERKVSGGSYSVSSTTGDAVTYTAGSLTGGTTYTFRIRAYNSTLVEYGDYSTTVTITLTYTTSGAIKTTETYVGMGNILAVATLTPTNMIDCCFTTKPLDYADQDPNMENFWKIVDRIHLDFVDLYPDTPVTVLISADSGVTWDRIQTQYLGVGDGKNKCYDFWYTPLTAQYHVFQLQSADNVTAFCWTGFDVYYEPGSRVFELGKPGD